jgi:hypothetical protein
VLKPDNYDGQELRKLVDGLAEPFEKYMRDEIKSLLALEKYGRDELLKAFNVFEKAIVDMVDKVCTLSVPLLGSKSNWKHL